MKEALIGLGLTYVLVMTFVMLIASAATIFDRRLYQEMCEKPVYRRYEMVVPVRFVACPIAKFLRDPVQWVTQPLSDQ